MEIWKDIPNYEGYYQVSNLGKIKSLTRTIITINGTTANYKERLMTLQKDPKGYMRVRLTKDGKANTFKVHRLVCEAFNGSMPQPRMEARHINGIKDDNVSSNIEWGTSQDNRFDQKRHKVDYQANKTHCSKGHLYDSNNTYVYIRNNSIHRHCKLCKNINRRVKKINEP